MRQGDWPATQDLVLIGGGHAHALVLRKWGMDPLPGVRLTLINPGPTAPYTGMLPGFVAGHYGRDDLDIDLVQLARFAKARLILGAVDGIDPAARKVSVPGYPPIAYDALSVDIGITSAMPDLPGFTDHAVPAKPLEAFAIAWERFLESGSETGSDLQMVMIGGGVAGVELAMAMVHALKLRGKTPGMTIVDRGEVLGDLGPEAGKRLRAEMAGHGIALIEDANVTEVCADGVILAGGRFVPSTFTTGAAGARPYGWLRETGLTLDGGFITVGPTLQSSDPQIFAVGDCAYLSHAPRPKAGVFAVRAAPVLMKNLKAILSGGPLRPYLPQVDYLKLMSLGRKSALAEKFGTARQGALLWHWKDRIDTVFMRKFRDLPQMQQPSLPVPAATGLREALGEKPMCGGCGAKVGRGALRQALATVPQVARDDVTALPGDDSALLLTGGAQQVLTTDHLRTFTEDPVIMARIAAVHALGDIWAMGAAPQAATATIILPRMSAGLQERTLAEIMQSASAVFGDAGAAIVGGHSSLGDELTIGFTVTGLCAQPPVTLQGAQPGDALILTKPLGSGTLLAAEMAGQARGGDVAACYAMMAQGQAQASLILRVAHAMTDVTGFGLAGHLLAICEASGVRALLEPDLVPLMQGAEVLAKAGTRSSLHADNRQNAPVTGMSDSARHALLHDPQTAGGLLAAVEGADAARLLAALQAAGYQAAIIGRIETGAAEVRLI